MACTFSCMLFDVCGNQNAHDASKNLADPRDGKPYFSLCAVMWPILSRLNAALLTVAQAEACQCSSVWQGAGKRRNTWTDWPGLGECGNALKLVARLLCLSPVRPPRPRGVQQARRRCSCQLRLLSRHVNAQKLVRLQHMAGATERAALLDNRAKRNNKCLLQAHDAPAVNMGNAGLRVASRPLGTTKPSSPERLT